jgi:adenylyltransferase/sulfurtransferase
LQREQPIVVHCHSGTRSAQAVRLLQQRGFSNVYNLEGGIDAWSDQIDPSVPKY